MKKIMILGMVLIAVFMAGCYSTSNPYKEYGVRNPFIGSGLPNPYCDNCSDDFICAKCSPDGKSHEYKGIRIPRKKGYVRTYADPNYKVNVNTTGNASSRGKDWVKVDAIHRIKPNAYGLGTHMNQFGAPMKAVPAH